MNRNRLWVVGSTVLAVVILTAGYFVGIAPLLTQASVSDADRAVVEDQNLQQEATLLALKTQFADLAAVQTSLDAKRESIPADADLSDFFGELASLGTVSGAVITDIAVSDGVQYVPPVADIAAVPVPSETTAGDAGTTQTDTAAAVPGAEGTPPASAAATTIPGAEAVAAGNFVAIPLSITVSGTFQQGMDFVDGLQTGDGRIYLVTAFAFTPDQNTEGYSAKIDGYVYVLTASVPDVTGGTGSGAAATTASIG